MLVVSHGRQVGGEGEGEGAFAKSIAVERDVVVVVVVLSALGRGAESLAKTERG